MGKELGTSTSEETVKAISQLPESDQKDLLALIEQFGVPAIRDSMSGRVKTIMNPPDDRVHFGIETRTSPPASLNDELLDQRKFFEQMFVQSSLSTVILNHDGRCERVNPKFCEVFGISREDMEGGRYDIFQDGAILDCGLLPKIKSVFEE